MGLSKFITRRDPQEIRDLGINNNDYQGPIDTSTLGGLIRKTMAPVRKTGVENQMGGLADYLDVSQLDLLGNRPENMPMTLPENKPMSFIPGYNEEMNIDDSGKINFADYLKQFGDTAQGGLSDIADKGMSLFDNSKKSGLIRAGLGSMLFGFNPLTAILGAVIGQKAPGIYSALQNKNINPLDFIKEKRAEREATKAAAERANLDAYFRGVEATGGDTSDRYDGASSMEEYSADPTSFSGSS